MSTIEPIDFPNVWFSTEEKWLRTSKLFPFSDIGHLIVASGAIRFQGMKYNFKISQVQHIYIECKNMAWRTFFVSALAGTLFWYLVLVLEYYWLKLARPDLLGATITWTIIIICFAMLKAVGDTWVAIEFIQEDNQVDRLYFKDMSWLGFGNLLGKTKKLVSLIEKATPNTGST